MQINAVIINNTARHIQCKGCKIREKETHFSISNNNEGILAAFFPEKPNRNINPTPLPNENTTKHHDKYTFKKFTSYSYLYRH